MIDSTTKQPLHVLTDGGAGPYIEVPWMQIEEIRSILDQHAVKYEVDEDIISWDGGPEMAMVYFGRRGNARSVQQILDSVN